MYATNLTPGGPLQRWTDGEIVRAIREGLTNDGRSLLGMPSQAYRNLSDADVQALVAYLRSQPAVDNPQPARNLNVLAALFLGAGMFPTSAQAPVGSVAAPPLKPFAGGMSEAQFMAVFREGRRMDGSQVAEGMPWKNIGKTMSDDDLRAVQAYLQTLP
jgi:hypothetical protein